VLSSPATFTGKYLLIHGEFEKDLEHTIISNSGCKKVLAVIPTEAANDDPGMKALLAVFYCPPLQIKSKRLSGDFVGRFEWLPGQRPSWIIHLDRVSGVHIEVDGCGITEPRE
jgi:hypothetical protein